MKTKAQLFLLFLFLFLSNFVFAAEYYVATTGSDANPGTINQPFLTVGHLLSVIQAGDTGYIRGGTYQLDNLTQRSGTTSDIITIKAYNGEVVILEGTGNVDDGGRFRVRHNWYHFYGLELRNGAAGFVLTHQASNNIIENCKVHNCYYTGFYVAAGAADNQFINCDAYDMYDSGTNGGNADGFGINGQNSQPGPGNVFIGCRAWNNSDDGFDVWKAGHTVTFLNCYSFNNGTHGGDGNGFKLGINATQDDKHVLKNCVAWGNRQNGFDYNDNSLPQVLYNCTAYNNGRNYRFSNINGGPTTDDIQNCISAITQNADVLLQAIIDNNTNSWNLVVPNDDSIVIKNFISTDDATITGPRNADGTIPDSDFLKLKAGSIFIDAGVDVGLPYNGNAPDLGAFEAPPSLPTHLLYFRALLYGDSQVKIEWTTSEEQNNDYFLIEKSKDGMHWDDLSKIAGAGNSNTTLTYSVIDDNPYVGLNYYRLKQVDFDGNFSYSNIEVISINPDNPHFLVYPNPNYGVAFIQGVNNAGSVKVFDILGRDCTRFVKFNLKDSNTLRLDIKSLTPGMYLIQSKSSIANKQSEKINYFPILYRR